MTSAQGLAAPRPGLQADVYRCIARSRELSDQVIVGRTWLQVMLRKDGQAYAAYIHSAKGIDDRRFEYCLASTALLWKYEPQPIDTTASFSIVVDLQVILPPTRSSTPSARLDVARAQDSLNVLDDASFGERALASLAVHNYPDALAQARRALEKNPEDLLGLRALAQTLAESKGDLNAARQAAERLSSLAKGSVVGGETLLRVCAAQGDDACVYESWNFARSASDVAPRSRILQHDLRPLVEQAAARLRRAAPAQPPAPPPDPPAAAADVCASETEAAAQGLCEVKRCLDAGSALYAKEISKPGLQFELSDWKSKSVGKDRLLVTRLLLAKNKDGSAGQNRSAIFLVKLGDAFSIEPSSADARKIALEHNACAANSNPPAPK